MITPKVTLLEYAGARGFDPATLAEAVKRVSLPETAGIRDGQDIYPTAELDAALGVTGQDMTAAEYTAHRGLSGDTARLLKRSGAEPVGERDGHPVYPGPVLDRVCGYTPGAVTLEEYAAEHNMAVNTFGRWRSAYADVFPAPVEGVKRGRKALYWRHKLDVVRRRAQNLPDAVGAPGDLMTWDQVCEYLESVTPVSTMRWRRSRGTWPEGVVGSDGVERWRRFEVDAAQARLAARGKGPAGE